MRLRFYLCFDRSTKQKKRVGLRGACLPTFYEVQKRKRDPDLRRDRLRQSYLAKQFKGSYEILKIILRREDCHVAWLSWHFVGNGQTRSSQLLQIKQTLHSHHPPHCKPFTILHTNPLSKFRSPRVEQLEKTGF
jgi:hypothetical protein